MDFVRYADLAASLVNAPLDSDDDLATYLADRKWLLPRLSERDLPPLRRLRRELRGVFAAAATVDAGGAGSDEVVARVNALLARYPVAPHIAGHDSESWHLHVAQRGSSVSSLVTAECIMGLAMLIVDFGANRLGTCSADKCANVFVDTSPNTSRRYCSDRCSSRSNVAAYRARRKAGAHV